jgi:hypothetical protein
MLFHESKPGHDPRRGDRSADCTSQATRTNEWDRASLETLARYAARHHRHAAVRRINAAPNHARLALQR